MTSSVLPAPFYRASNNYIFGDDVVDHDNLNSLLDLDDIFSDIVSSLENKQDQDNTHMGTPCPLTPYQANLFAVPVSPSASCNGLSGFAEVVPRTLAEMTATPTPVSNARVSPSQSPTNEATEMILSNPKKRIRSASSSFSEADEDKIQNARRERNKEHAKRSRQRKKSLTGGLQQSLIELKEENVKLRGQIYATIGQKKADSIVNARLASPTEKCIEALKKPETRVVDSSTQAFLQGLRNNIPYPAPAFG